MAIPLLLTQAKAANLEDARWVTRTDAPVPYVRMVMDLSAPVKASASISKDGKTTTEIGRASCRERVLRLG